MSAKKYHQLSGLEDGVRIESRVLEERLQAAVVQGHRNLHIKAFGQHGIGGRLWPAGNEAVHIKIDGHPGQRVGSMGFANTRIDIYGPASDDVGWLNAGAHIVIHGNAANGCGNAMAQGKVYVGGNIGARGMTMTKANPRFAPPELWVLGSAGDYFGEFMAGGTAVVCGHEPQNEDNILGYRPFVGMVSGRVFFRGPHDGFSQPDARMAPISDADWQWLLQNMKVFLENIHRPELLEKFSARAEWQLLVARTPQEKLTTRRRSMQAFRTDVWDRELGRGGLIGDLDDKDRDPIPMVVSGELRRFVPVWENRKYAAPCEATCPTGIPVHERWRLVREGRVDEAVDLALAYTPFPATVCGYLCPNPCMQSCTRQIMAMPPVDITQLGQASIAATLPELPSVTGKKIGVIGAGPAGISVAWQLRQQGHEAIIYDMAKTLGGKISSVIPSTRIPKKIVDQELARAAKVIPHVNLQQNLTREDVARLREDHDYLVLATGAQKPRIIPVPGKERMIPANDFLAAAKENQAKPGKRVVVIGAGNVGCDAATEAARLGADDLLLIDVQEPLSFGKEREEAEKAGAKFRYPCFTEKVTAEGVVLNTGELLPADTVIISIGDAPDLDFLPDGIDTDRGYVKVNDHFQTSDAKIFAIGDLVKPGLLTDAIGAGRKAAAAIGELAAGRTPAGLQREMIDRQRVSLEYFDPRIEQFDDVDHCGSQCSSCGACRDCGVCIAACPQTAISKTEKGGSEYEYVVDPDKCIGCGFCAGACPCGVWNLVENEPLV